MAEPLHGTPGVTRSVVFPVASRTTVAADHLKRTKDAGKKLCLERLMRFNNQLMKNYNVLIIFRNILFIKYINNYYTLLRYIFI